MKINMFMDLEYDKNSGMELTTVPFTRNKSLYQILPRCEPFAGPVLREVFNDRVRGEDNKHLIICDTLLHNM